MKTLLAAAALGTILAAGQASAQAYVGAGLGAARTDSTETSAKLYGGFQVTPNWGAELAYTDLGRYRGANIGSWSLAGTGTMPLGSGWSLMGKLGAASNRPKFGGSSNHSDVFVGLGVGYAISKNLGVRLEYEDFGKLSNTNNAGNSRGNNLGLSLQYGF
jgi:OOP family OmpA-OmpF porin